MKQLVFTCFFLFLYFATTAQSRETDSLNRLYNSPAYHSLTDSLRADLCRRLSIENIRKSGMRARQFAEELYTISLRTGDLTQQAIALNLIGVTWVSGGNLKKGLEYYLQSLDIRRKFGDEQMISNALNNIGTVYVRLGKHQKGLDHYSEALEIRKQYNDSVGIAQTLNNIGVTYKRDSQYDSAMTCFEKSLKIKRELGDKELIASTLNNLGEIAALKNQTGRAMEFYNEALACRRDINDVYGTIKSLLKLSGLMADEKNYSRAMSYLQEALQIAVPGFDSSDPDENPVPGVHPADVNTIEILGEKASLYKQFYQQNNTDTASLKKSFDIHQTIIAFIEQIRRGYDDEKSKLYLMENYRQIYGEAITTAIQILYETKDSSYKALAFELAEKGKSRVLYDLMLETETRQEVNLPDSVLQSGKDLKKKLALYRQMAYRMQVNEAEVPDSVKDGMFAAKRNLEAFTRYLEQNFPEYNRQKYRQQGSLLQGVQQSLDSNELYIQYHLADTVLYTFLISNARNSIIQVSLQPDFRAQIDMLNEFFTGGASSNFTTGNQDFNYAAFRLYEHLIYPVKQFFDQEKYIIVPDGQLYYIPFEVLLTEFPEQETSFKSLPFLLRKHPVSYNYSASMYLRSLQAEHIDADNNITAFALEFEKEDYNFTAENIGLFAERNRELAPLPGVKKEIRNILAIIPGKAYFNEQATEHRFKCGDNISRVLHIATHGIIDNSKPMFSKLVFAGDKRNKQDGNLYTWELYNMELNADLAVLSACNTGYGKLEKGEGMMTLARGFMYAGVPSLVISLWNANDEATVNIMEGFYSFLSKGLSKDVALQKAKLNYLSGCDEVRANPYFWGSFVLLGNDRSLEFSKSSGTVPLAWIAGAALFLVAIAVLLRKRFV